MNLSEEPQRGRDAHSKYPPPLLASRSRNCGQFSFLSSRLPASVALGFQRRDDPGTGVISFAPGNTPVHVPAASPRELGFGAQLFSPQAGAFLEILKIFLNSAISHKARKLNNQAIPLFKHQLTGTT